MPMDFPDLRSLEVAARVHKFRPLDKDETEESYRSALADHVSTVDFLESEEIRNGIGWDRFSKQQNLDLLKRKGFNL
jgi:hypothetical protein